jgi:cytochrome c oxidase cbb3-type subunit 4|tara:strand:+ start:3133 stop:3294 length:162 start_codon:yes stop_codon:yes gene_type:complete
MDMNTLRGIATIVVMTAFLGICFWAYSSKRKAQFDDAANSVFADEPDESDANK